MAIAGGTLVFHKHSLFSYIFRSSLQTVTEILDCVVNVKGQDYEKATFPGFIVILKCSEGNRVDQRSDCKLLACFKILL